MYKALLADDSLTIQKVIKITLSNEPFQIVNCRSEEELFAKLEAQDVNVVFLDFSISDTRSGYEVCADIVQKKPGVAVLMLFGTFDTADDAKLKASGASDKIVKPFESSKFIGVCKKLTEKLDQGITAQTTDENIDLTDDVDWEIDEAKDQGSSSVDHQAQEQHSLEEQLEDWGVAVPGVIIKENETQLEQLGAIPGVIGFADQLEGEQVSEEEIQDQEFLPSDEDLEYPDLGASSQQSESDAPKSKLIPLEEMNPVEQETQDDFEPDGGGAETDGDIAKIMGQLEGELPSSEDLWSVDEYEVADAEEMTSTSGSEYDIESLDNHKQESLDQAASLSQDDTLELEVSEGASELGIETIEEVNQVQSEPHKEAQSSNINLQPEQLEAMVADKVAEILEQKLEAMVKEAVKAHCEKAVGAVAWDVIPDLAENTIKNEISKITQSILDQE